MYVTVAITSFLLTLTCVKTEQESAERCPGPPDRGPCNEQLTKWAYDAEKKMCVMFTWGGCAGNDKNRFDTKEQCRNSCEIQPGEVLG